jgi:endoglucanase
MLAQHVKPFNLKISEKCKWYAQKAYAFGINPKNSLGKTEMRARNERGAGEAYTIPFEEKEAYIEPFQIHAAVRMYLLTKDTAYLKGIKEMLPRQKAPISWPYSIKDYSPWMFYQIAKGDDQNLAAIRPAGFVKDRYLRTIDKFLLPLADTPYRCSFPKNQNFYMGWGLTAMTNYGRSLLIAHALTGDRKYRDAAILNCDFMLGANAMGMSWTTGLGQVYPIHFQSGASQTDGIPDPIPGITIYGINGGMYYKLRDFVWRSPGGVLPSNFVEFKTPAEVPLWRRWSCHPTANTAQCEYTIHETISATIVCAALLLSPGWKPSPELKARKPRPVDTLHGLWYLP